MDTPIYPETRNKYSRAAGYNNAAAAAAINRALGIRSPPKGRRTANNKRAPLPPVKQKQISAFLSAPTTYPPAVPYH